MRMLLTKRQAGAVGSLAAIACVITCVSPSLAHAQRLPPEFRIAPQLQLARPLLLGASNESRARLRHIAVGGVIGAVTGVVVCTLISNFLVNSEVDGITTCTTKGYLLLGGGGFVLGAAIGALWKVE